MAQWDILKCSLINPCTSNYLILFILIIVDNCSVPGLPGTPQDCRVGRESNASLGVVCVAGWSGGLAQTFHLGRLYKIK